MDGLVGLEGGNLNVTRKLLTNIHFVNIRQCGIFIFFKYGRSNRGCCQAAPWEMKD